MEKFTNLINKPKIHKSDKDYKTLTNNTDTQIITDENQVFFIPVLLDQSCVILEEKYIDCYKKNTLVCGSTKFEQGEIEKSILECLSKNYSIEVEPNFNFELSDNMYIYQNINTKVITTLILLKEGQYNYTDLKGTLKVSYKHIKNLIVGDLVTKYLLCELQLNIIN